VAASVAEAPADSLLFVNVHGLDLDDKALYSTVGALAPHAACVVLEIAVVWLVQLSLPCPMRVPIPRTTIAVIGGVYGR